MLLFLDLYSLQPQFSHLALSFCKYSSYLQEFSRILSLYLLCFSAAVSGIPAIHIRQLSTYVLTVNTVTVPVSTVTNRSVTVLTITVLTTSTHFVNSTQNQTRYALEYQNFSREPLNNITSKCAG